MNRGYSPDIGDDAFAFVVAAVAVAVALLIAHRYR